MLPLHTPFTNTTGDGFVETPIVGEDEIITCWLNDVTVIPDESFA